MIILLLFILTELSTAQSSLLTQGAWIINSTSNQRVHLKCANWYGAHQELFVPSGLERSSVARLADFFKSSGANCARIPFSVEMAKYNPPVLPSSVAGIIPSDNCTSTRTALDVMDCVVSHLQSRGILIIFNCHNSYGTWVGAGTQKYDQGLWNLPGFSTEDWIQSLETFARRYRAAGMDFRNEIHDQDGVKITWGKSTDPNSDWLAASSLAYDRLHAIDPELLAIVGGLCWNFDLRAMAKNVGPLRAFNNRKLVYTVHVYPFSFWWQSDNNLITTVLTPLAASFAILFLGISTVSFALIFRYSVALGYKYIEFNQQQRSSKGVVALLAVAASNLFFSFWLVISVIYSNISSTAGCSSLEADARPYIIASSIFVALSGLCLVAYVCTVCCYPEYFSWFQLAAWFSLWMGLFFASVAAVGWYFSTDRAYYDFLGSFALNNRPVPVWIGEFGTGDPSEYMFQFLWKYISETYNLDFAYWAFNGRKYKNGAWESESIGLLNDQYTEWRFPWFVKDLFK